MSKEITKKGSQVDTVEQENFFYEDCQGKSEDVHTYFESVELGTVSNNSKETVLYVDASSTGLGAVIMQDGKTSCIQLQHTNYK